MLNIGDQTRDSGGVYPEAVIVQSSFMVVLTCHIPFIFFSGKEALCIFVDEILRKSISRTLWNKIKNSTQYSQMRTPSTERDSFKQLLSTGKEVEETESMGEPPSETSSGSRLAYKDMSPKLYFTIVILYYIVTLLGAILIKQVAAVFDICSAIVISSI